MLLSERMSVVDDGGRCNRGWWSVQWASRSWPLVPLALGADDQVLGLNAFGSLATGLGTATNVLALLPLLEPH